MECPGKSTAGGGGGGRIAIHYDNVEFTGEQQAFGGLAATPQAAGGSGTIFLQHTGQSAQLYVIAKGKASPQTVDFYFLNKFTTISCFLSLFLVSVIIILIINVVVIVIIVVVITIMYCLFVIARVANHGCPFSHNFLFHVLL